MAGALDGIKVLELTRVGPGAFCTMMLADMGAEVLKIEAPPSGKLAGSGASPGPEEARKLATNFTNRNKKSMTLNLKDPAGQAVLHELAKEFDVLVEGFRPGVMKRLGGDYETLRALNPRLIYCSLSGYGQDGPYRDYPAHDINYLSLAGVLNRAT
jgi:crotonobetainyl-CoA:carnitine CoA-transferase CaiB-like acyl-CoA transferase